MAWRWRVWLGTAAAAALLTASGCSMTPAAQSPEEVRAEQAEAERARDPNALPAALEELALSDAQRAEVLALQDGLRRHAGVMMVAGRELLRAVARSSRQCKGDWPFVALASSRVVAAGEEFRPALLDAVDALHALLTPEQRQALSARLLDEDRERAPRDDEGKRKPRDNRRIQRLGGRMDLSFFQMMKLLVRLAPVRDDLDDQVQPWRDAYREALAGFVDDDFSVRDYEIARAPATRIVVSSLRKALRVSVPLLDPEQCRTMGDIIDEELDAAEARADAARAREEAAADGQPVAAEPAGTPAAP